ncbi:pyridoxamine 5'-phosphate oxidase family protein [Lactobacillus intestinalis]|uniref:pyridoxamine 5'-phosphate oxidase family protein n=1 Tax=Lactobacillus intestinalis TaxID=151781 RepID=UPI001F596577|nr:pyridoxamine 5'-phosphate oxidase family protein [Lactobacillus intestinalis]
MRKAVPKLDDSLTNDQFLNLIVESFQSVLFGTVNKIGNPITNVADIEVKDANRLIFATAYQKAFYDRLKNHPRISITALKGNETLDSVGFTLNGDVHEVDDKYLDEIFAKRPEILRPFAITPINGSIYDLRQQPIFQKQFKF